MKQRVSPSMKRPTGHSPKGRDLATRKVNMGAVFMAG
jgi:hypothetical protein